VVIRQTEKTVQGKGWEQVQVWLKKEVIGIISFIEELDIIERILLGFGTSVTMIRRNPHFRLLIIFTSFAVHCLAKSNLLSLPLLIPH